MMKKAAELGAAMKLFRVAAKSKYSNLPESEKRKLGKSDSGNASPQTQTNLQKKKKKKVQPTGMRMSGTGSKSKTRSLIDPM